MVRDFRNKGFIEKAPYSTVDAIHSYAAQPGHTILGLPFVALVAWEEGSQFFGRGPGTSPGTHISLVVQANSWELGRAVREKGLKVTRSGSRLEYPAIRVSGFNSEYPDELPKRADPRFAYAELVCQPRL